MIGLPLMLGTIVYVCIIIALDIWLKRYHSEKLQRLGIDVESDSATATGVRNGVETGGKNNPDGKIKESGNPASVIHSSKPQSENRLKGEKGNEVSDD